MKNVFLTQSSKRILKRPEDYIYELNFADEDIIMCNFSIFDCSGKLARKNKFIH